METKNQNGLQTGHQAELSQTEHEELEELRKQKAAREKRNLIIFIVVTIALVIGIFALFAPPSIQQWIQIFSR